MDLGRFAPYAKLVVYVITAASAVTTYLMGQFVPGFEAAVADSSLSVGEIISLGTILAGGWGVWRADDSAKFGL